MSSPVSVPAPRSDSYRYAPASKKPNTGLLKDKLQLVRSDSTHGSTSPPRYTIKKLPDQLPFDKGLYVLVGLAGASGSGKTTFCKKLQSLLPSITVLSMDMYNDSSKLVDGNFDDPRLTDYELLLQNLHDLRAGRAIQAPIYDFKHSKRVGYRQVDVPESRIVVVEGIYALSPQLRPLLDLRVSITGGVHFDLAKRVLRDINRSAQAPQEILQQITDTVYPMYKAFIEPDLQQAQLVVVNHFNPFSGFMNPIYILKSQHAVDRSLVQRVLEVDGGVESDTYDIYLLPPGEDPETCVSWLRMRNRDGKYTLMFEEWVVDDPFVISPRVQFEVSVRVLGGLMSLGYEISVVMNRHSVVYTGADVSVKFDTIEGIPGTFVQIQGRNRERVLQVGTSLGLAGTYIARSYIELVQLERLTSNFQTLTEDLKRKFAVDGEPLLDEHSFGSMGRSPPPAEFLKKITGFDTPDSSRASWSAPAHREQAVEVEGRPRHGTPMAVPATAPAPHHTPSMPVQIQKHPSTADEVGVHRGLPPLFVDANGSTRAASMPGHQANGLLTSAMQGGYGGPRGGVVVDDREQRFERALDKMATRVEDAVLSRARSERSERAEASDAHEHMVVLQQSLLREMAHLSAGIGEVSSRLLRAEMAVTAASLCAGVCLGAVAATLFSRRL